MGSIYRTGEQIKPEQPPEAPEVVANGPIDTGVEVPFSEYERSRHRPYAVEYFDLGSLWDDPSGGFYNEIETINDYFTEQINKGRMANTISSVKKALADIEKVNNLKREERTGVRIGTVAAYIKFLKETQRYGTR